jgi:ABC-2 type transport system permease protein
MNYHAVYAIYLHEMQRMYRTLGQTIFSPVLSTILYFIVFGSAIGSRISEIDGVAYGSFIVPGLVMLTVMSESIANGSFGIFFPRFVGTIYELLSAPVSAWEIVLGYVGAATCKSLIIGTIIMFTASFFVEVRIAHPLAMVGIFVLSAFTFSLFGFIIGIWADNFEQLQIVPLLVVTPLAFLGGSFYSIKMLSPLWQQLSLFNPVVYLISGFRWSFFDQGDVSFPLSVAMMLIFLAGGLFWVRWIFRSGYRLKN